MKNHNGFALRILGGCLRGKKIEFARNSATRPTKAILRESLFDTLGHEVFGAVFIEMFAGSGSVGIEAVSRGAHKVVFIEQNQTASAQLYKNCTQLQILESVQICCGDCFALFAPLLRETQSLNRPIILYCDPPFAKRAGKAEIYTYCLQTLQSLALDNVQTLVFETMHTTKLPQNIAGLNQTKSRCFGKSALQYYRLENAC